MSIQHIRNQLIKRLCRDVPRKSVDWKKKRSTRSASERANLTFGADQRRSSPYWDFWIDGISPSGIAEWLRCREHFRLKYVEGFRPKGSSYNSYAEFGNLWHAAHEAWTKKGSRFDFAKWLRGYRKRFDMSQLAPPSKYEQETAYALIECMWPHYERKYQKDLRDQWFMHEGKYRLAYKLDCGRSVLLNGTMDGGFIPRRGILRRRKVLHEMKTKSRYNSDKIRRSLRVNLQAMTYAWMLRELSKGKEKFGGISYDVVRNPSTKPRKGQTFKAFKQEISDKVSQRPLHYFDRMVVPVSDQNLDDWHDNVLHPIMHDLRDWSEGNLRHYPNDEALQQRNFGSDLFPLIVEGDESGYERASYIKDTYDGKDKTNAKRKTGKKKTVRLFIGKQTV